MVSDVLDRVNTICASPPYVFTRAREPFGLDLQPSGSLDRTFYVGMELIESVGMIGYQQDERWETRIAVARKAADDPHAAYRQLTVDMHSLTASLAREMGTSWCFEDGFEAVVQDPDLTDDVVVGELIGVATVERSL